VFYQLLDSIQVGTVRGIAELPVGIQMLSDPGNGLGTRRVLLEALHDRGEILVQGFPEVVQKRSVELTLQFFGTAPLLPGWVPEIVEVIEV
jgi:hypothetical protein